MRRALISVSDKTGIVELARALSAQGIEIISTGGTQLLLKEHGVPVIGISEVTGFPEIMDGRVKTLHPAVHSGLLAVRDNEEHREQMKKLNYAYIDIVVVNLYPFAQTIANPDVSVAHAIENIDIGGPTMLRSAAKNHAFVTVVVDAADYELVSNEIKQQGDTTLETRQRLAAKVFRHTAAYDSLIGEYLSKQVGEVFPERYTVTYEKVQSLRYGENPHQQAAFYRKPIAQSCSISTAQQLHGKELSYNNINDANTAMHIVKEFSEPTVVAVKHMNPCGVGIGATIVQAFQKAYAADPTSIFGGIVAANRPIDEPTARLLHDIFLEIIIAPHFTPEAIAILIQKKNVRLLQVNGLGDESVRVAEHVLTSVDGGVLIQDRDVLHLDSTQLQQVTQRKPSDAEMKQLWLAWKVVKHVKSNAIVIVHEDMTIGIGAGQMNRVGAAKIALEQAGAKAIGAVMASDAFFPMSDTLELAAKAGITAVIQPGGSIKDEDSIRVANEYGIAMVMTGIRHFKH